LADIFDFSEDDFRHHFAPGEG